MIDFIKLLYKENNEFKKLVMDETNFPDLESILHYHTGEVKPHYRAKFGSLDIRVNKEAGYIKNSLHKFYNNLKLFEEQNYNDFGYYSISEAIEEINYKFKIANQGRLTQLEFGLNVIVDSSPQSLVSRNFLIHKNKAGSSDNFRGEGELKRFIHSNYLIKVYDKGMHFKQQKNILRFEIKFIKAIEFNTMNIYTLNDLKDKTNLRKLFLYLIKRYDELTIVDDFNSDSDIEIKDYFNLMRYTNPIFWSEELKGKHPETKKRYWNKFNLLLHKNRLLKTKESIRKLLVEKFIFLMNN